MNIQFIKMRFIFAVLLIAGVLSPFRSLCQTIWSSSASTNNWNTAGNWSAGIPALGTVAQFSSSNPTSDSIGFNANATTASLSLTSGRSTNLTFGNSSASSALTFTFGTGTTINGNTGVVLSNLMGGQASLTLQQLVSGAGTSTYAFTTGTKTILAGAGPSASSYGNIINITAAVSGTSTLSFLGSGSLGGNCGGLLKLGTPSSTFTNLTVGGTNGTNTGILELDNTTGFAANGVPTINVGSQLYLNASGGSTYSSTSNLKLYGPGCSSSLGFGALTMNPSNSYTWSGAATLDSGAVISVPSASALTITGAITNTGAGAYPSIFNLGVGSSTATGGALTFNGIISGAGSDTVLGNGSYNGTSGNYGGILKLGGANNFTGSLVVGRGDGTNNGIVEADVAGAMSTGACSITINPFSQLFLNASTGTTYTSTTGSLSLNGYGPGNSLAYTGRGAMFINGKTFTIGKPIVLGGNTMITDAGGSGFSLTLSTNSTINTNGFNLIDSTSPGTATNAGNQITHNGIISGSGSLTELGGGTSSLTGGYVKLGAVNTVTGGITVGNSDGTSSGTLDLSVVGSVGGSSNTITINSNSNVYFSAISSTYNTISALNLNGSGGNNSLTGGGAISTTTGYTGTWPSPISLGSNSVITERGTSGTLTLSGTLSQSANHLTFKTGAGSSTAIGSLINVTGAMSGSASDTILGGGSSSTCGGGVKLGSSASTFNGGFNVGYSDGTNAAELELDSLNGVYNSSSNYITVNNNSQLYLSNASGGTYGTGSVTLNLNGNGNTSTAPGVGALINKSGVSYTWPGPVNIASNAQINTVGASTVTLSSNVSGSGQLTKSGVGTLLLSASSNNSWSGGTLITGGAIYANSTTSIGTGPLAFYQASGAVTVTLNSPAQTIGTLSSNWTSTTGTVAQTLTLNGTVLTINQTGDSSFGGGAVATLTSKITGTGEIIKAGSGKLIFTGTQSFTGGVKVNAGEIRFNGTSNFNFNSSPDTLNGGAITTTNVSAPLTVACSTLVLADNSTIDLGTGYANALKFAASNTMTWTTGKILTVTNWTGTYGANSAGTVGQLFFGTTNTGLTAAQIAQIQFKDASGNIFPAQILSTGEIVPKAATITTTAASFGPFCNAVSNGITVVYTTNGRVGRYMVQLSDASGTFTSDTTTGIIGSGSSSPISATIPISTAVGTGYKVRVISGAPIITYGSDNGTAFTITAPVTMGSITGSSSIAVSATTTLSCTPAGGTWSSSNNSIATVAASTGVVTGVSAGSCTISYVIAGSCGGTSTFAMTVASAPTITTTAASYGPYCYGYATSISVAFTYTGTLTSNCKVQLSNSSGTFPSDTTTNIIGTGSGTTSPISAVIPGTTSIGSGYRLRVICGTPVITYGSDNGSNFSVLTAPVIGPITGTTSAYIASTSTLSDTSTGGTWSSSNTSVASVNSSTGVVTGISGGTCTISFTKSTSCGSLSTTTTFTVNGPTITTTAASFGTLCTGTANVISVAFTHTGIFTSNCKVQLSDASGVFTADTSVNIIGTGTGSSSPITATIPSSTAVGSGYRVRVICGSPAQTFGSDNGSNIIIVAAPTVGTISGSTSTVSGTTVTLTCTPSGGTWSSSNTAIASVNSSTGVVTGVAFGTCNISYTTTSGCGSTASTSVSFAVTGLPIITSVSPLTGNAGDTITLSGSYFNATPANNTVFFGATKGTIVSGSTTSLTVVLDTGATYGPVTVLNTGVNLSGISSQFFTPTYDNSAFLSDSLNFKPNLDFAVGTTPNIAAIADLDGDGKPDFVAGNKASSSVTVYRNTGSPATGQLTSATFSFVSTLSASGSIINVKIADIDRDGKPDILVISSTTSRVYVFRNTTTSVGSITFASGVFFSTLNGSYGGGPQVLAITDIDQDGKPDIVVSATNGGNDCIAVLRNTSTTGATLTSGSFASAVTFNLAYNTSPQGICAGDFDGDGKPDIAVTSEVYNTITIFQNTATSGVINSSSFSSTTVSLTSAATPVDLNAADIDGDGKLDLIASNAGANSFSVFRNTSSSGSISFHSKVDFSCGSGSVPVGICATDFNGDGKVDVVVTNYTGGANTVNVFRNTATSGTITSGSFATRSTFPTGSAPAGVVAGDMDGDGYPEILTGDNSGNAISVLKNYPLPKISAITGTFSVCASGDTIRLSDSTSGGWWVLTNAKASINSSTGTVTGVTAGYDTALYYVVRGGDTNYVTAPLSVLLLPVLAPITGNSSVCPSLRDTLTEDSTRGTYSWSLSNTSLATISGSGIVTGIAEGSDTAIFTLLNTTTGCRNKATFPITVNHPPVSGTITGTSICAGATTTLTRVGGDSGGTWSSSNTALATVSSSGVVGGVSSGNPIITYSITNSCGSVYDTARMTINPLAVAGTITGTYNICTGSYTALSDTASGGTWTSSNTVVATVSATGVVYGVTVGTATISYTVSNSCGSVYATQLVTINAAPSAPGAITGTTTICTGGATTTLADTTAGGSWSSSNASVATVGAAGIVYSVGIGTTTITYTVTNSCGTAYSTTSINVIATPTAHISSAAAPCTGYTTNIIFTGTSGATVGYQVDGGSVATGTLTGGTFTYTTAAITSSHSYTLHSVDNGSCAVTIDTTVVIAPQLMQWVGGTTGSLTAWNIAANWSCGVVPGNSDHVIIPVTTYNPVIPSSSTYTVASLSLASGATLTINGASTLSINGNLVNNGVIGGTGTIVLGNASGQLVSGVGSINNLTVSNSSGASIDTASKVTIVNCLTLSAGAFATNDSLLLASDSNGTAYVAPIASGASISGNVQVNHYIPGGYRRYRFWSHPFTSGIALSQIEKYIDVTGTGGSTNGFTTTGTNAPSAYRYNPLYGNSSAANDPGWIPYTSAYGTPDSNLIHQYQGLRLFIRGAKHEGLDGFAYTPSAVTIGMFGHLNQGSQTIYLTKGSSTLQDYNQVGVPYPSPTDIGTVIYNAKLAGNINGSAFYVFNPFLGAGGQFQVIPISSTPYYLQSGCSFQVRAAHNGDSLNFAESNKSSTATTELLKVLPQYTSLYIYDANYHPWDMLYLQYNDAATDNEDHNFDGGKLLGSDFNFYTISGDNQKLSIDARPYKKGSVIPLGIKSGNAQEFIIRAESVAENATGKLYLHDKLLKQYVLLQAGTEYKFNITADAATQGENRFELSAEPAAVAAAQQGSGLKVAMTPNPANDLVNLNFTSGTSASAKVRVMDLTGVSVYNKDLGVQQSGSVSIDLSKYPSGIYLVELTFGDQKVIEKLVKE